MWKTVKISDVCEFQSGLWKGKKGPLTNAYVIRNTNFRPNGNLSYENIAFLEVEVKELSKRKLQHGDIILEKSGGGEKTPVGRVCLFEKQDNETPFSLSNFTCFIRIKQPSVLDYKYLHKFLYFIYETGKTEQMQRNSTGIRNLQLKEYKDIFITFPPIIEQKRIVAKLDAVLTEIDNAISTEEEKKNQILPVLKSIYRDILYNRHLSTKNKKSLLGDISRVVGGNGFPKRYQGHSDKEIPFIKVSDMNTKGNEKFIYKTAHTVDANTLKAIKAKAHEAGTLIFPKIGGAISTNKKRLINKISAYDNNIVGIKPSDKLLPEYLHKIFKIIDIYDLSNKAALPSINNPSIESIELFVPDLQEQSKIIKKLNLVDDYITNLSDGISSKIHNFKLLKLAMIKQNLSSEAS